MATRPTMWIPRDGYSDRRQGRHVLPGLSFITVLALVSSTLFGLLLVDALLHPRATFDLRVMQEIQAIDAPGLARAIDYQQVLTDSAGAIACWAAAIIVLGAYRQWVALAALLCLPLGGVVNYVVGEVLVQRPRPDLDVLVRVSSNPAKTAPSRAAMSRGRCCSTASSSSSPIGSATAPCASPSRAVAWR